MRLAKAEKGNVNRSTLEELLRGNIAGLPEVIAPKADAKPEDAAQVEEGYAWATTEYVYDITQAYNQVIQEKTTGIGGSFTSAYAYGLERIAAYGVCCPCLWNLTERRTTVPWCSILKSSGMC